MLTRQLLSGLFVIRAYSLQDWNIDTRISDIAASEPVLQNGISDPLSLALATADGSSSEFAQSYSNGPDIVSPDGMLVQGGSGGCSSDTRTHPRRIRSRDEKMCPPNLFQPNSEEEQERTLPQLSPNAQKGGGRQNTGGSGGSRPPPIIPPEDSKLPFLFIPEEDRPKENSELCPEAMHPVPVCGRPRDIYLSSYPYNNELTLDPCYRCM